MENLEFLYEILDTIDIKKFSCDIFDISLEKSTTTKPEYRHSSRHSFDRCDSEVFFSSEYETASRFVVFDFFTIWTSTENLNVRFRDRSKIGLLITSAYNDEFMPHLIKSTYGEIDFFEFSEC